MRCSRSSWPRRSARLCLSDLPPRARYEPHMTRPGVAGTAPPRADEPFGRAASLVASSVAFGFGLGLAGALAVADGLGAALVAAAVVGGVVPGTNVVSATGAACPELDDGEPHAAAATGSAS